MGFGIFYAKHMHKTLKLFTKPSSVGAPRNDGRKGAHSRAALGLVYVLSLGHSDWGGHHLILWATRNHF